MHSSTNLHPQSENKFLSWDDCGELAHNLLQLAQQSLVLVDSQDNNLCSAKQLLNTKTMSHCLIGNSQVFGHVSKSNPE
jgi:hypothetical protein